MNGRYLLDTNIIIALFAKDPQIHTHIVKAEEIFIPSIAIHDLTLVSNDSHFDVLENMSIEKW